MMEPVIYKIEHWALSKLNALIEKYNKRSAKLGAKPLQFNVKTITTIVRDEEHKHLEVSFEGDPAKITGWEFVGTIQHLETGNILRGVPGRAEIPEHYRSTGAKCEHCNKVRSRKDSFVLKGDGDQWKQVGRNCLRDFLGHDPTLALAVLDMIRTLTESADEGRHMTETIQLIEMAAAVANQVGFSKDSPTMAWNYLFKGPELVKQIKARVMPDIRVDAEAIQLAQQAMTWIQTAPDSSFIANVRAAANMRFVTYREARLAAWVVGAYLKEIDKSKMAQTKAQLRREQILKEKEMFGQSRHFGQTKDRMGMKATLLMSKTIGDGAYGGVLTLHKFQTETGDIMTWMTQTRLEMEVGETKPLKFTVKEHRFYEGIAETAVHRLALEDT